MSQQQHEETVNRINDAFRRNDMDAFLEFCTENVTWTMVGEASNTGKAAIREWMSLMPGGEPPKFTVDRLISNDDTTVCYGDMTMKSESGDDEHYSFCDIYTFDGDGVADLRSFVVKIKPE